MKTPNVTEIVAYLETLLDHAGVADWPNALNGLQVENSGRVRRIGAAVDACEATLTLAAERGIDFLLVHHGLFWSGNLPVKGPAYRKLKLALNADMAVFSSHLPLDLHPKFGNNIILSKKLGFKRLAPFFFEKGKFIGLQTNQLIHREALCEQLAKVVNNPVKLLPSGPLHTRKIGLVTGGAGNELFKAAAEGVDTFITGEGSHWTYTAAEELGINVLYAGHYATETFGVKALAEHLSHKYRLPWEFIDHPTGM